MKAEVIVTQGRALLFEAWATLPSGAVRRLPEFVACSQAQALSLAFSFAPTALAMSVREADRPPARDALGELDRRAQP